MVQNESNLLYFDSPCQRMKFHQKCASLSPTGERLYLTASERGHFLSALDEEDPTNRMFCQLLHFTGCRPTEALQLIPRRVLIEEQSIVYRSLKKRRFDSRGREKQPQYRTVPVPQSFIEHLDLVFDLRARLKRNRGLDNRLWPMSRPTAYRLVKRVMDRAGIVGHRRQAGNWEGATSWLWGCNGHSQEAIATSCTITAHGAFRYQNH